MHDDVSNEKQDLSKDHINLQNEFNITNNDPDATAEAIIRAQKNGIKVIL